MDTTPILILVCGVLASINTALHAAFPIVDVSPGALPMGIVGLQ